MISPATNLDPPVTSLAPTRSRGFGVGLLLVVTLIWGTTFVATRVLVAGDAPALMPGAVTFWRFAAATLLSLPILIWHTVPLKTLRHGLELSFWLWAGYATQALGLQYTTASKSAFITSLNVVFVPILTVLAGGHVGWLIWSMASVALVGAGLLSYDGSDPNRGDLWTLGCAITYAVYILRLERHAGRIDSTSLTLMQLWGVTLFSLPWMLIESAANGGSWGTWSLNVILVMAYLSTIATLGTTWLQTIGQQTVPGTHASLLYTTEPVFASAIAIAFFGERLGMNGWIGAGLILLAAIASQAVPMIVGRCQQGGLRPPIRS